MTRPSIEHRSPGQLSVHLCVCVCVCILKGSGEFNVCKNAFVPILGCIFKLVSVYISLCVFVCESSSATFNISLNLFMNYSPFLVL